MLVGSPDTTFDATFKFNDDEADTPAMKLNSTEEQPLWIFGDKCFFTVKRVLETLELEPKEFELDLVQKWVENRQMVHDFGLELLKRVDQDDTRQLLTLLFSNDSIQFTMSHIKEPLLIWILSNAHAAPLALVSRLTYKLRILSGHDYSSLLNLVIDSILKSNPVPLDVLAILANLVRDQDNRAIVKKYPSCSRLYKKLTTLLTDDDEKIIGYALQSLIYLLYESSHGKKLFSPSNMKETFNIIFTAIGNPENDPRVSLIFTDLFELMMEKAEFVDGLSLYAQKHWSSQKFLPWCSRKGSSIFRFISLLVEKGILKDYVNKTIETLDLLAVASRYLREGSAGVSRFLLTQLENADINLAGMISAIQDLTIHIQDVSKIMFFHLDPNMHQLVDALFLKMVSDDIPMELNLTIRSLTEAINQDAKIVPVYLVRFWINICFLCKPDAPISDETSELLDVIANVIGQSQETLIISEYLRLIGQINVTASNIISEKIILKRNSAPVSATVSLKHYETVTQIEALEAQLSVAIEETQKFLKIKEDLMKVKMNSLQAQVFDLETQLKTEKVKKVSHLIFKATYEKELTRFTGMEAQHVKRCLQFEADLTDSEKRERALSLKYTSLEQQSQGKDDKIGHLERSLLQKNREIEDLTLKLEELEDSLGEQEQEHQEMVAKLAKSLDSLANRKPRVRSKPALPRVPVVVLDEESQMHSHNQLNSIEGQLENTKL